MLVCSWLRRLSLLPRLLVARRSAAQKLMRWFVPLDMHATSARAVPSRGRGAGLDERVASALRSHNEGQQRQNNGSYYRCERRLRGESACGLGRMTGSKRPRMICCSTLWACCAVR